MPNSWKFALVKTLPVMCGYLFLGMAFGILLQQAGYSPLWATLCSLVIYAGSMQFLLVGLLASGASLPMIAAMTLLLNSRHLFYGLSFIEKFREFGKKWFYMVFSLTDETYSVFCSLPERARTPSVMFPIALLDHCYWVAGSTVGALAGTVLPFDATGIDFAMTALFVVIFLEQWKGMPSRLPAVIGGGCALVSLVLLGPDNFLLPALAVSAALLMACRRVIAPGEEVAQP